MNEFKHENNNSITWKDQIRHMFIHYICYMKIYPLKRTYRVKYFNKINKIQSYK